MKAEDHEFLVVLTGVRKSWTMIEMHGKVMCYECAFCGHEHNPRKVEPNRSLPDLLDQHIEAHLNQFPPARRRAFVSAVEMGVRHEDARSQVLGLSGSEMGNFFKSGRVLE